MPRPPQNSPRPVDALIIDYEGVDDPALLDRLPPFLPRDIIHPGLVFRVPPIETDPHGATRFVTVSRVHIDVTATTTEVILVVTTSGEM